MWNSISKFFGGLMVGSAVGYVLGVLSAPKPGSELRRELAESSEDLYKQAGESLSGFSEKTGQALQDIQHKGEAVLKKASASVQGTRAQLASKLDEIAGQSAKVLVEDAESRAP
jgi:gas vesicle protein